MKRHSQVVGKDVERVDDFVGSERSHVDTDVVDLGAANGGYVGTQQFGTDGNLEVDVVVVGHGDDARTAGVLEPCGNQGIRMAHIRP